MINFLPKSGSTTIIECLIKKIDADSVNYLLQYKVNLLINIDQRKTPKIGPLRKALKLIKNDLNKISQYNQSEMDNDNRIIILLSVMKKLGEYYDNLQEKIKKTKQHKKIRYMDLKNEIIASFEIIIDVLNKNNCLNLINIIHTMHNQIIDLINILR